MAAGGSHYATGNSFVSSPLSMTTQKTSPYCNHINPDTETSLSAIASPGTTARLASSSGATFNTTTKTCRLTLFPCAFLSNCFLLSQLKCQLLLSEKLLLQLHVIEPLRQFLQDHVVCKVCAFTFHCCSARALHFKTALSGGRLYLCNIAQDWLVAVLVHF